MDRRRAFWRECKRDTLQRPRDLQGTVGKVGDVFVGVSIRRVRASRSDDYRHAGGCSAPPAFREAFRVATTYLTPSMVRYASDYRDENRRGL